MPKEKTGAGLRIGMISRLSGVPAATIRMWERRYGALTPSRSPAGGRLYSRADVARLALLKQLVDRGHAIGTVAGLAEPKLQQLAAESGSVTATAAPCRIAAVGGTLPPRLKAAAAGLPQVRWAGAYDSIRRLLAEAGEASFDAAIAEIPTLGPAEVAQALELLRKARPRLLIVVYAFGAERDLAQLRIDPVLLLRGRIEAAQLLRICQLSLSAPPPGDKPSFDALLSRGVPEPVYSEADLAGLANSSNSLRCECPRHLSDLLLSLGAFERYSIACQNLNEQDAAVHALLRNVSGHARALLEEGLRRVIALDQG
ncbi:MAG TPA: MerR family transcriptional regulator [Nevskia sp.]|nr:MerR family transcriptional regulator [Nevskia sp.]